MSLAYSMLRTSLYYGIHVCVVCTDSERLDMSVQQCRRRKGVQGRWDDNTQTQQYLTEILVAGGGAGEKWQAKM